MHRHADVATLLHAKITQLAPQGTTAFLKKNNRLGASSLHHFSAIPVTSGTTIDCQGRLELMQA